jgi:hypothetical protein
MPSVLVSKCRREIHRTSEFTPPGSTTGPQPTVASRRRRHERRSHPRVQVEPAMLAWSGCPQPFPFAEVPRVRIRLPPPGSLRTIGSASGWPPDPQQPILIRLPARGSCGASPVGTGAASHDRKFGRSVERECLLAEFPSVLGVVRCAVEIQRGMIPISLSSIATISIFAHWPLALRAEATT